MYHAMSLQFRTLDYIVILSLPSFPSSGMGKLRPTALFCAGTSKKILKNKHLHLNQD